MRRLILGVAALAVVAALGVGAYLFRLTAPVDVATTPPTFATIALEADPTLAPTPTSPVVAGGTAPDPTPPAAEPTRVQGDGPAATAAATAPPPAPKPTKQQAPPPRVFRIDPKQSKASYAVGEVFLEDNRFNRAVGTTSAVGGEILVNPGNPSASRVGEIVIDISQLESDSGLRDNAIRRKWLESAKYPRATFKNAKVGGMPESVSEGKPFRFKMTGEMTVHETTRQVTWDVTATLRGSTLQGKAATTLKMSQFNVEPPNVAGFVRAEDAVALTLEFVATAVR